MKNYSLALGILNEKIRREKVSEDMMYAYQTAIEALDKQIPKMPEVRMYMPTKCPCCDIELSTHITDGYYRVPYNQKVCECGQKLKWEDEGE